MIVRPSSSPNDLPDSTRPHADSIIANSDSKRSTSPRATTPRSHHLGVALDVPFAVPFTHRVRSTHHIAGDDFPVLMQLLIGDACGPVRVMLVAENPVAQAADHVTELAAKLRQCEQIDLVGQVVTVDGGEAVKNDYHCVQQILAQINSHDLDRRSYVIAIGGGAMLDAVGFATAIAHRGIRLIRLPTTTLAQGDSGVGVKNAINYFGKKNWVGTFSVPWAVINDSTLLETLSDRDFCSGFSESVKVTLLKSRIEFDWLCDHADRIRAREMAIANQAIATSCELHLRHITEGGDPFEMLEARPLDFGHWSAHKLEPITDFQIRHGEAVGIGVAIDCFYSHLKFGFPIEDVHRVCDCLARLGLPLWHVALTPLDRLLEGLEEFRQHLGGRLTITMLRDVGNSINVHEIDAAAMAEAIHRLHVESERIPTGR